MESAPMVNGYQTVTLRYDIRLAVYYYAAILYAALRVLPDRLNFRPVRAGNSKTKKHTETKTSPDIPWA